MANRLEQLLAERNHKSLSMRDLCDRAEKDSRPMTPEEIQLFDKLKGDYDAIEPQIKSLQETEQRRLEMEAIKAKAEAPAGRVVKPDQPGNDGANLMASNRITRVPATARPISTLKAFKGDGAEERAYRAGQWLRATVYGNERATHWCIANGMDLRNAMGTNSNTDGGFLVPDELSQAIIVLREQYGVIRRECQVWPMSSDVLNVPRRLAGITIAAIGENPSAAISQSTPTFNQVKLVAKKFGGLALLSSELAEDAVLDIADYIANEFAYALALFEDTAGFTGDGTSTYGGIRGLTNLLTGTALKGAVQAASAHDTFAEIDSTDLANVMGALPEYARMDAKWYMSAVAAELTIGRLQQNAGGNTITDLQTSQTRRGYLGYPVVISQVLPTSTGTINATPMLYFGNLSMALAMGDRRAIRIFASEHRYMDTDQVGIRCLERIDINFHDYGDNNTAGPIVALIGKT